MRDWQRMSSERLGHLWLTDGESLVAHLKNPKNEKVDNVRLSIDFQRSRQVL